MSLCLAAGPALADAPGNGGDPSQGEEVCASGLYLMSFDQPVIHHTTPMSMVPVGDRSDPKSSIFLLIADTEQNTIRMVGEQVRILAGSPTESGFADGNTALFDSPSGITVDEQGNAYVADRGNHAIRKVYPDGRVETIAGGPNDEGLFNNPMGIAYWTVNGKPTLFVADTDHHCIRRIDLSDPGYPVDTVAGYCGEAGSFDGSVDRARFDKPRSIDAWFGGIVIADQNGIRLLKDSRDGLTVSTIVTKPGVQSVFASEMGDLYITQEGSSVVEGIPFIFGEYRSAVPLTPCGGAIYSPQTTATFFGQLIVADRQTLRVISEDLKGITGVKRDCPRCGPRIPLQK